MRTDQTSVYTVIQNSFGVMESECMSTPREKSLLPEAQRRVDPRHSITQDSEPNTLPTDLFRPPDYSNISDNGKYSYLCIQTLDLLFTMLEQRKDILD